MPAVILWIMERRWTGTCGRIPREQEDPGETRDLEVVVLGAR